MTILLTRLGRAHPVAGTPQTILQRIDAIDGGPSHHWRLADTGAVMAARAGTVAGTWRNTADLVRSVDPITSSAAGGKSTGFGAHASAPGHGTIAIGVGGLTLMAQHTIHQQVQIDRVASKYVMLAVDTIANGQFSREFISDGQGGMIPRVFTRAGSGVVSWIGSIPGTVPIGDSFSVDWVQQHGSLRVFINGVEVALTPEAGTIPGTWMPAPAGALFVGAWPTLVSPFNGLMSELVIWNSYLFTSVDASSLVLPQNVVWARALDAGAIPANQLKNNVSTAAHQHPEVGTTIQIVDGAGTRGTLSTDGTTLDYQAGATAGIDTAMSWRVSHANGLSPTVGFTIEVTPIVSSADLPFRGLYYGADCQGAGAASTHMKVATERGVSYFFYAERTGTIDQMFWQPRMENSPSGVYSDGDGGEYLIQIRAASAGDKLPVPGGAVISSFTYVPNWLPGQRRTQWILSNFTSTPGATTAGNPYCIVYRNISTSPGGPANNFISNNVSNHNSFSGSDSAGSANQPPNYQEPAGINPASITSSTPAGPVQGFVPMLTPGGQRMFPRPVKAYNGDFQYNRMGAEHACLHYTTPGPNGTWTGFGFAGGQGEPDLRISITAANQLRVPFRVSRANRTVDGLFVRIARINGTTGTLTVRLESGPALQVNDHFPGNGTEVHTASIGFGVIYNAGARICSMQGACGDQVTGDLNFTPYLWVPFGTNRTLAQGTNYNLRLFTSGGLDCELIASDRPDGQGLGSPGTGVGTWTTWESSRQVPWQAFEDSRGLQISSNSGATWAYTLSPDRRIAPITFRCV